MSTTLEFCKKKNRKKKKGKNTVVFLQKRTRVKRIFILCRLLFEGGKCTGMGEQVQMCSLSCKEDRITKQNKFECSFT